MINPFTLGSALLLGVLLSASLSGQPLNSEHHAHQAIADAAKEYLETTLVQDTVGATVKITPLDHRLKLARCEAPLEAFSPPGGVKLGRTTVGIRCQTPSPWSIYISANVSIESPVVVAVRDLARGQAITGKDLKIKISDTSHLLRGYFETIDEVVGQTSKRTIRRGQVVTPSMLVVRKTIKRGDQVTIVAGAGGIQVRMQGKAMKQGNPGDLITVMNTKSKKQVEARVVSKGLVMVD
ncbi:MAG: flagellar basal body P-ring formation protein FlgA [Candidatus Thiodiazotropha taylori]|nr:flagellar basal body P-ring formation protein FlgA [Candidatus Thiodiazotropha taylori]